MLGIDDPWIWMAYLGCVLATALCVVYGVVSRFRAQQEEKPAPADRVWAAQEDKIEEKL